MKNNIKVDVEGIAAGLYEMFTDEERAALAFGMLPAKKMEILEKTLKGKAEELFPMPDKIFSAAELKEMEFIGLEKLGGELCQAERKDWVSNTVRAVTLAIYGVAPMVV